MSSANFDAIYTYCVDNTSNPEIVLAVDVVVVDVAVDDDISNCNPTSISTPIFALAASNPTTFNGTDIDNLVILLSDDYRKIIPIAEIKLHDSIWWGANGVGDRWARSRFNYTVVKAKSTKLYSEYDDDKIPQDVLDPFMAEIAEKKRNKKKTKIAGIIGIYVHSKRTNIKKRPINATIHKQITSGTTCVVCGTSSEIVCDHKNDLYNDDRVLDVVTQKLDDFQPLCNHCNLQKRQVCKNEELSEKLYSAKSIARYRQYDFEFPWEKKAYDRGLYSCKADTFWYDPVEFDRKIYSYATQIIPLVRELKRKYRDKREPIEQDSHNYLCLGLNDVV